MEIVMESGYEQTFYIIALNENDAENSLKSWGYLNITNVQEGSKIHGLSVDLVEDLLRKRAKKYVDFLEARESALDKEIAPGGNMSNIMYNMEVL